MRESIGVKEGCPGLTVALLLQVTLRSYEMAKEKMDAMRCPVGTVSYSAAYPIFLEKLSK